MRHRIAIMALTLALLSCGCGKNGTEPEIQNQVTAVMPEEADAAQSETQTEEPDTREETEDHVLLSLTAEVDGGQTLRLEAVGKKWPDMDQWGVREVRILHGGTLLQTVLAQEAIGADGGAVGEGYTQCPSVEEVMAVRDMNFDGYDDLDLFGWISNNAVPHCYWLYDPETRQYRYAFTLRDAEPRPETREISSWYKYENGLYCTDYYRYAGEDEPETAYRYGADGLLVLVRRDIEDWKNGTEDFPLRQTWEYTQEGAVVLCRQEFTDYDSEGRAVREIRELVDGRLVPVRLEYLEVADGSTRVIETVPVNRADTTAWDAESFPLHPEGAG